MYRKSVGIVLFNASGLLWFGERADIANQWQFPQGGIDVGETPLCAAKRELQEETGIKNVKFIRESTQIYRYQFPAEVMKKTTRSFYGNSIGQELRFFLFKFEDDEKNINFNTFDEIEFRNYRWSSFHQMEDHIVPFKREMHRLVCKEFEDDIMCYCR